MWTKIKLTFLVLIIFGIVHFSWAGTVIPFPTPVENSEEMTHAPFKSLDMGVKKGDEAIPKFAEQLLFPEDKEEGSE